jgi:hypothetical protein
MMMMNRFVTDADEELANTECLSLCGYCRHKHFGAGTCDAFRRGIPDVFLSGDAVHTKPIEGDGGIIYEQDNPL